MGFPVYIRDLPDTEIDRGHVHVSVGGVEFVATMHLYGAFLERECAKYIDWLRENGEGADIIKLSERGPLFLREGRG